MTRLIAVLAVALATLAFASCTTRGDGSPSSTPSVLGNSGVRGIVLIGPTCPVERPESPCPDRPFEATIELLDDRGRLVRDAQSGADGRFEISVVPGAYTLHPLASTAPPYAPDQPVIVEQGAFTDVTISYDSGIR